jgi:hypothetical protein
MYVRDFIKNMNLDQNSILGKYEVVKTEIDGKEFWLINLNEKLEK